MATYILIHGGNMSTDSWNRLTNRNTYPPGGLLGAGIWDGTAAYLEAHGHRVFAPTLADEHTHDLSFHVGQVCRIIADNDLKGVVLVGHSYGGMVITGAAGRMRGRIRRLVYVDAALPDPGQSLFDLFAAEGARPLSFPGLEAAPAYVQKLQFDKQALTRIQKSYILCTESEFAVVTKGAKKKVDRQGAGWEYLELPATHVPMATMPDRFCRLMLSFAYR